MTTLLSWLSFDARRPAALYIASDSRISWATNGSLVGEWSRGRKVFAATTAPDIFGFAGDVVFAAVVLGQLSGLIDANALFAAGDPPAVKATTIEAALRAGLDAYPRDQRATCAIFYGTRSGARVGNPPGGAIFAFHFFTFRWLRASADGDRPFHSIVITRFAPS